MGDVSGEFIAIIAALAANVIALVFMFGRFTGKIDAMARQLKQNDEDNVRRDQAITELQIGLSNVEGRLQ